MHVCVFVCRESCEHNFVGYEVVEHERKAQNSMIKKKKKIAEPTPYSLNCFMTILFSGPSVLN